MRDAGLLALRGSRLTVAPTLRVAKYSFLPTSFQARDVWGLVHRCSTHTGGMHWYVVLTAVSTELPRTLAKRSCRARGSVASCKHCHHSLRLRNGY